MGDDRTLGFPRQLKDTIDDDLEIQTFEEFKLVRSDTFRGALTVDSKFDRDRAEWRVPQSNQLEAVLSKFQDSQEDRDASWEDVLDHIEKSRETYAAKAPPGSTRARARKSEGAVKVLASLTDMIPDEKGLSVLRCSLSLVFRAWANRLKNVKQIMSLLEDIPAALVITHETWKCYRDDLQLQNHVKDYFQTALSSLKQLLAILLKERNKELESPKKPTHSIKIGFKKATATVKDVGNQIFLDADTELIQKITSELRDAKSTLVEWVQVLDRRRLANTSKTTQDTATELKAMRYQISQVLPEMKRVMDQNRDFSNDYLVQELILDAEERGAQRGQRALIQDLFRASRRGDRGLRHIPQFWAEMIQTGFYKLVAEDSYKRQEPEWTASQLGQAGSVPMQTPMLTAPILYDSQRVTLSIEELFDILGVDPQISIKDEENTLREGNSMLPAAVSHASGIMTEHAFKAWLLSPNSSSVVVDGHCRDMGTRGASPISVFCASLAASLAKSLGFIVLDYFCARHARLSSDPRDPSQGPRALMASLITQLLVYPDLPEPNLDFITENLLTGLQSGDILAFCQLFEDLFLRMSRGKITICIIDSISDFEVQKHGWDAQVRDIHRRLLDVVYSDPPPAFSPDPYLGNPAPTPTSPPPLKLLLTSPGQSRLFRSDTTSHHVSLSARRILPHPSPPTGRAFEQDVNRLLHTPPGGGGSIGGGRSMARPSRQSSPLLRRSFSSSSRLRGGREREGDGDRQWRGGSLEPGGV